VISRNGAEDSLAESMESFAAQSFQQRNIELHLNIYAYRSTIVNRKTNYAGNFNEIGAILPSQALRKGLVVQFSTGAEIVM
jgi:hypothetical protein